MRRVAEKILYLPLLAVASGLAGLAFWYRLPLSDPFKIAAIAGWAFFCLSVMAAEFTRYRKWPRIAFLAAFLLSLLWWHFIHPSNDRIWADDVARTVTGSLEGSRVTLHNVRNFTWRTVTDYDRSWETRDYDLNKLSSVDLFLSSWGNPDIAHTLISFGFSDGTFVTFSVEIRKERHEVFSEIAGFFKQYEIALIAADERDIIYTRTNVRKEDVSLYRVALTLEQRRSLFLSYVDRGNNLARNPSFYNTLTANCTTVVFDMVRLIVPTIPLDARVLLSGRLPSYIYDLGGFGHDVTLSDIIARAPVTERAQKIERENFSRLIRKPSTP